MSQRCHKFSFVCHAQTSRDRRKRTTPRERAKNLLQNCLFSKKSLITLRCRDFFKNKKPKALQFSRRTRAAFLIPDNVSPNLSLFRRGRYEFEQDRVFLNWHISRTDERNLTYNMSKIIRRKIPIEWCTWTGSNLKRFVFTTTTKRTTMITSPMMMPAEIIKS